MLNLKWSKVMQTLVTISNIFMNIEEFNIFKNMYTKEFLRQKNSGISVLYLKCISYIIEYSTEFIL